MDLWNKRPTQILIVSKQSRQCSGELNTNFWRKELKVESWAGTKSDGNASAGIIGVKFRTKSGQNQTNIFWQSCAAVRAICCCRLGGKLMSFWAFVIFSRDENAGPHPKIQQNVKQHVRLDDSNMLASLEDVLAWNYHQLPILTHLPGYVLVHQKGKP